MGTRDPFHLQNVQTQALESFTLLFSGYRDPIPEIKRPEFEVDHSSYSNAEAKNEWSCDFTPLVRLLEADKFHLLFSLSKTVSEYEYEYVLYVQRNFPQFLWFSG